MQRMRLTRRSSRSRDWVTHVKDVAILHLLCFEAGGFTQTQSSAMAQTRLMLQMDVWSW